MNDEDMTPIPNNRATEALRAPDSGKRGEAAGNARMLWTNAVVSPLKEYIATLLLTDLPAARNAGLCAASESSGRNKV